MPPRSRMTFSTFIDRAFWTLLLGIAAFGVKFLGELSHSVAELNVKMEAVVFQTRVHDDDIRRHEDVLLDHGVRIATIETRLDIKEAPHVSPDRRNRPVSGPPVMPR